MMSLPLTPETEAIARRVIWFEPPVRALSDTARFMAYAYRYATHEDMRTLRTYLSDQEMAAALERAPPGIIDPRSWSYWNWILRGLREPPPLPRRTFEPNELA